MHLFKPALLYFGLLFGTGFMLGPIRVFWLEPRVGLRTAELLEMPIMLVAMILAARWVNRQVAAEVSSRSRLIIGFVALMLVLIADSFVGLFLRKLTLRQIFLERDPVSGTVYYFLLLVFALLPASLSHIDERKKKPPAGNSAGGRG